MIRHSCPLFAAGDSFDEAHAENDFTRQQSALSSTGFKDDSHTVSIRISCSA